MTGKVIGFVKAKGGVGATTTTACLLDYWNSKGRQVIGIDADPTENLVGWRNEVEADDGLQALSQAPVVTSKGPSLRSSILRAAETHDYVIVDTAGELAAIEASIVMGVADLLVIPVSVGSFDLKGAGQTLASIAEAEAVRGGTIPTVFLLARMKRTKLADSLRDALASYQVNCLSTVLYDRTAYPETILDGRGPWTAARGSLAAREVESLAVELEGGLNG